MLDYICSTLEQNDGSTDKFMACCKMFKDLCNQKSGFLDVHESKVCVASFCSFFV